MESKISLLSVKKKLENQKYVRKPKIPKINVINKIAYEVDKPVSNENDPRIKIPPKLLENVSRPNNEKIVKSLNSYPLRINSSAKI